MKLPDGFDMHRLVRGSDPYTSLIAAQKATRTSCKAIENVARLMLDGKRRIDEDICRDCCGLGFRRTLSTIQHARLALSEAGYLVEVGARETSNGCKSREWIWYGAIASEESCQQ